MNKENIYHVLLTGGAGFIGSNIANYLIKNGNCVTVIDNLSTGNKQNIIHLIDNPNFKFVNGDITNIECLKDICSSSKINMICHQAAIGSVPRSIKFPMVSHNNNVNGFMNILMVALEFGIKRIVYSSSSSVYGDSEVLPKVEDVIGNQLSPYAITKYVNELYAKLFYKLYGIETIGLRYFNVFGPNQNPLSEYSAVIPKFIHMIKNNEQPIINGDGSYSRDFTYVDNVVNANYLALKTNNSLCYGKIFNIGCGSNISILEMFNKIKKIVGSKINPIFIDSRVGDIPHSHADINKASSLLKYNPIVSFDEGLILTINWMT